MVIMIIMITTTTIYITSISTNIHSFAIIFLVMIMTSVGDMYVSLSGDSDLGCQLTPFIRIPTRWPPSPRSSEPFLVEGLNPL